MRLPGAREEICEQVYAPIGYQQSARNLGQTSLNTDSVFGDVYVTWSARELARSHTGGRID